ncbi:matrixin family metalloprotease [Bradyrhizobium lablabi]|uniref:matrixin family metalloprotease n=1 Tax=Bradyrhizobium lablabi TaxID=722472 RepID=UPI001BA522E2|nr:matrixin family metalloprotease [Bradyrhizobium lablabi]MBR1123543.1 matrixin family metalloprotease [Bradyrhizobium lablabi]
MPTIIPAQYIGSLVRPKLHIDDSGQFVLDTAEGLHSLYIGPPASMPYPPIFFAPDAAVTAYPDASGTISALRPQSMLCPLPTAPTPLRAADGGVEGTSPTAGEAHLTQTQLDFAVATAITQWAQAGASAAQLAKLSAIAFTVADLAGDALGKHTAGHIEIDADAAGHGWFIDPTPNDNSEFAHAGNAAGTDLSADPASAAAGHLDLLTAVMHEMGHELGLDHTADAHDLMYASLADGKRRLPAISDVAQADGTEIFSFEHIGVTAPAPPADFAGVALTISTVNAGHAGGTLTVTAGADGFVFAVTGVGAMAPSSAPLPIPQLANYNFADGDHVGFSALTAPFHAWVDIAQIAGDHLNMLVDSHNAAHHLDLLI